MTDTTAPVIYQASPVTGEYVGRSTADPSPLEPGVWLIPSMATMQEPPQTEEGFVAVLSTGAGDDWAVIEDDRGLVYDTGTGRESLWEHLGPLPESLTKHPRPGRFHVWAGAEWQLDVTAEQAALKSEVLNECDMRLSETATRIAPLQYAVDLDMATEADLANLESWKRYSVSLSRINQQPGFPQSVDWPAVPSIAQDAAN